jgi:putative oxidoreductase
MGRLLLRLAVGGFFFGHGTQKLFGWFGGGGLEGTGGFFESNLGLRPGRRHALAAGVAEAGGGTLLALGLATPLAAAALTGVMVTAIRKVHWTNGPWVTNGGYEYNAVLIAAVAALVEAGPGDFSLDEELGLDLAGPAWTVAALAGGALGSLAATATSAPAPPPSGDDSPAGS